MNKKEPVQTALFDTSVALKRPSSRRRHDDYEVFVKKFELKKTTDDCYTPSAVYDAVLGWVTEAVDISGREIVRPFWPGGDYENFDYPDGDNGLEASAEWRCHMRRDLEMLAACDAIYMLEGWHASRGARIELRMAVRWRKMIMFEQPKKR